MSGSDSGELYILRIIHHLEDTPGNDDDIRRLVLKNQLQPLMLQIRVSVLHNELAH
jgi:hypothetical protein